MPPNDKIKVCWLITPLSIWGGVIKRLNLWARYFDKEKFDITIIYYSKDYQVVEDILSKNSIKLIHSQNIGNKELLFVPGILWLIRYLEKNHFDIIHSMFPHSDFIINLCSKILKLRVPVISYSAGEIIPYEYSCIKKAFSSLLYLTFYRIARNNFNIFITISENTKNYLINTFRISKEKIKVIKIGIDFKQYQIKPKKPKQSFINIGYAARFSGEKGLEVLLNAVKFVIRSRGNIIKLFLAGAGPKLTWIKNFIKKNGLQNNVELLGWVENISEFFAKIDVLILPSFQEGTPRIIIESFYHFVPVIASNVGGIPDIVVNNETGLLIDPGDFKALAEKILFFLDNRHLIYEYGQNAHNHVVENHDILKEVSMLEEVYKNLYMRR